MVLNEKIEYHNFLSGKNNNLSDEQKTTFSAKIKKIAKIYNVKPAEIKSIVLRQGLFDLDNLNDLPIIRHHLRKIS